VAEDQAAHAAVGCKVAGLSGGEVAILRREVGVVVTEGGFGHEQVDPVGELLGAGTGRGIHDEGETLARPRDAHVLQPDAVQPPFALQTADVRPCKPRGSQPFRQKGAAVGLSESIAVRLDAVPQGKDLKSRRDQTGTSVWVQPHVRAWGGERHERADHVVPGGGIVQMDRVRHTVEGQAGQDPGQAEAVIAVDMREADARDLGRRHAGMDHLPLGAFARIKEHALAVPKQQIAVMVPCAGRDL
jgi:hypothetical protein